MADRDITNNNASATGLALKSSQTISTTNHAVFQTIATMKTYLTGQGYTAAQLQIMSKNDMIYACRQKMGLL
jgi:hypothetical protein